MIFKEEIVKSGIYHGERFGVSRSQGRHMECTDEDFVYSVCPDCESFYIRTSYKEVDIIYIKFLMVMLVQESTKPFHSYGESGSFEAIANKAVMLMCALILQKPHKLLNMSCLQRHLSLWIKDDVDTLLNEGGTIQHQPLSHSSYKTLDDNHHISRRFAEHMIHRNVNLFSIQVNNLVSLLVLTALIGFG